MDTSQKQRLKCLLLPLVGGLAMPVRRAIRMAARQSNIELITSDGPLGSLTDDAMSSIANVDLVLAEATHLNPNDYYEIGAAHGAGKPVIFLLDEERGASFFPIRTVHTRAVMYRISPRGLERFQSALRKTFEELKRNPRAFGEFSHLTGRVSILPDVDFDRLAPREFENLCFELLTQMGFRRLEWETEFKEFDAIATWSKKDPDGFEYDELWLISMGLHSPPELLLEMASSSQYLWQRLSQPRSMERFKHSPKIDAPITLLLIMGQEHPPTERFRLQLARLEQRVAERRSPYNLRLRVWDRQQLVSLIQQHPQIAYKYFSEDRRPQSQTRKSHEELYRENVSLSEKLQSTIEALKEERDRRVIAERDAVWKDVAFTAAHKLGNPIFALETNLQGIKRRISTHPEKALEVATEMDASIEKAKTIIEQFKSLTKAHEIKAHPVDLIPLIKGASRMAAENGVQIHLKSDKARLAMADPVRMTECFDEIFANALHWLDKPEKRINILIDTASKKDLPESLNGELKYLRLRFEDNGCGVAPDKKEEIFSPFYTTHPHGTGLGLALIRRIVEGHGGAIREIGTPGEGAAFEIFLPQAESSPEK